MKTTARKFGGPTKGDEVEKKDMKNKEMSHSEKESEIHGEADAMSAKKGKKKQVGGPVGATARKHGGRAARASGGGCESNPFTSARAGTAAPGRKLQKTTMD